MDQILALDLIHSFISFLLKQLLLFLQFLPIINLIGEVLFDFLLLLFKEILLLLSFDFIILAFPLEFLFFLFLQLLHISHFLVF